MPPAEMGAGRLRIRLKPYRCRDLGIGAPAMHDQLDRARYFGAAASLGVLSAEDEEPNENSIERIATSTS